jgi:DNA-binding cell septation regulator SpoVG
MWFTTNDKEFKDRLHSVNNELRNKLLDIQAEFDKI